MFASPAGAGEFLAPMKIVQVRPYLQTSNVYLVMEQATVYNTWTYTIDMNMQNAEQAFAVALAAFYADRPVALEISNSGCIPGGFGTPIQCIVPY